MASKHRYTAEEKEWLKENHSKFPTVKILTESFNNRFNCKVSISAVRQQCVNYLGIAFGDPQVDWSEEENEFILQNYGSYTFQELSQMIFDKFGRKVTWYGVRSHCYKTLGLKLDDPGKFAFRWKQEPVGTEKVFEGYTWVKVYNEPGKRGSHDAYRNNWKMKHQIIWEQHHGPIPEGCQVIFLDRDRSNLNIENLYCIDKQALGYLTGNKMWRKYKSLLPVAIKWAELQSVLSGKKLKNYV